MHGGSMSVTTNPSQTTAFYQQPEDTERIALHVRDVINWLAVLDEYDVPCDVTAILRAKLERISRELHGL